MSATKNRKQVKGRIARDFIEAERSRNLERAVYTLEVTQHGMSAADASVIRDACRERMSFLHQTWDKLHNLYRMTEVPHINAKPDPSIVTPEFGRRSIALVLQPETQMFQFLLRTMSIRYIHANQDTWWRDCSQFGLDLSLVVYCYLCSRRYNNTVHHHNAKRFDGFGSVPVIAGRHEVMHNNDHQVDGAWPGSTIKLRANNGPAYSAYPVPVLHEPSGLTYLLNADCSAPSAGVLYSVALT